MVYSTNAVVNRFIEHPSDFLTRKNIVITGCVGFIAYLAISKFVEKVVDWADNYKNIPNIRVIFRKPYEPGLLKIMDDVLNNAKTDISFMGWRSVTATGYQGRISMEELADRIEWLDKQWEEQNQLNISEEERAIGEPFADKILNFYGEGDKLIKNWFTALLCHFRDTHFDLVGANSYGKHRWHGHTLFHEKNGSSGK